MYLKLGIWNAGYTEDSAVTLKKNSSSVQILNSLTSGTGSTGPKVFL